MSDTLSQEMLVKLKTQALGDLYVFAKGVLGFDWLDPNIHRPLCRLLELYDGFNDSLSPSREDYVSVLESKYFDLTKSEIDDLLEKGIKRLLIVLPRGWLKTTLCSIAYPMWRGVRDQNGFRGLLVQNTFVNAESKARTIKASIEKNVLLRTLFPDIIPDGSGPWRPSSLCLKRTSSWPESTWEIAGTKTQVTSRHYGLILEDDTVAPDKDDLGVENLVPTKESVDQAIGWHRLVPPLLLNPSTSQNIVVGTRWFETDLISWIEDHQKTFLVYKRSCIEDEKPTWPERFGQAILEDLKASMGPYLFSCLYLNQPMRSSDMVFKPSWITYYETHPKRLATYTTVDPGGDPEDTITDPDYNIVLTCGKDLDSGAVYVLDYFRKKCSPGELLNALFKHVRKFAPLKIGLETVAYQKSLKYWIREKQKAEKLWFGITGLTHTKRSKNSRILGLQPLVESGTLRIRSWMTALVNELTVFPLGKSDDLIDTLASQLELWQLTRTSKEDKQKWVSEHDPLSVDAAIKELRSRHERSYGIYGQAVYKDVLVFNS